MGVKYFSVDITKEEEFEKLPEENIYAVLFLATEVPSYMSEYNPKKNISTNALGAFNLLEYCRINNVDRILYTQTVFDISLHVKNKE